MRHWGWGVDGHDTDLPAEAVALLRRELGVPPDAPRREALPAAAVRLPDSLLPAEVRARLVDVVGREGVHDDHGTRLTHALGKSYPDLVRVRTGQVEAAPDAVVHPGTAEEVGAVLRVCAEEGVAVVPFGGGTSVVGGVEALRGPFASVVALDTGRLDAVGPVDATSQTAVLGAGVLGPDAEERLGRHGLTLGHLPQSFEFSTVGGWVATRSAGQASTGYGRADDLVVSLRAQTPAGPVATRTVPSSATGPDLAGLLVGSEGALGVLTDVTVRVRPRPAVRRYEAWSFPSFAAGVDAVRRLEQEDAAPDVCRLSDEDETRLNLVMAGTAGRWLRRGLRVLGHRTPCLLVTGYEGDAREVRARRSRARSLLGGAGGRSLGARPGEAWESHRFAGPYLRDELMTRGVLVDTLETATTWTALVGLRDALRTTLQDALVARGTPPAVLTHVSHVYPTGASLYVTVLARAEEGAELEQWHAMKSAATDLLGAPRRGAVPPPRRRA